MFLCTGTESFVSTLGMSCWNRTVRPDDLPRKAAEDERRLTEAVKANFLFSHLTHEKRVKAPPRPYQL